MLVRRHHLPNPPRNNEQARPLRRFATPSTATLQLARKMLPIPAVKSVSGRPKTPPLSPMRVPSPNHLHTQSQMLRRESRLQPISVDRLKKWQKRRPRRMLRPLATSPHLYPRTLTTSQSFSRDHRLTRSQNAQQRPLAPRTQVETAVLEFHPNLMDSSTLEGRQPPRNHLSSNQPPQTSSLQSLHSEQRTTTTTMRQFRSISASVNRPATSKKPLTTMTTISKMSPSASHSSTRVKEETPQSITPGAALPSKSPTLGSRMGRAISMTSPLETPSRISMTMTTSFEGRKDGKAQ